jgi:hypothetical protein
MTSDIVGFEMQLEFGGAVSLSFPPLIAHGPKRRHRKAEALILRGLRQGDWRGQYRVLLNLGVLRGPPTYPSQML